jgi:hypothetical protein
MGRPGYVLVARQMGKTNLLLRMKRMQEAIGNIVIYVDLSQRFESARACFRYIIDLAIDTNDEHFGFLANRISEERRHSTFEASLEYTKHLRLLLKAANERKIVIVLDEIDSLVNAAYSDTILAQVRSTYFVRTSYPEFENLTYVLSGVAEPSDLIKDKNISPFNIGERIYLDDFSEEQVSLFLIKVGIKIPSEAEGRLYYWAAGNPRITWDICAAIEEMISAGGVVRPVDIDDIVHRLYLSSFDRPPVDHIRVLVENDASLRGALISLRYGKADAIDERARSRLYLAGITRAPGEAPTIRNAVIDACISDAWLAQLEVTHGNPLTVAVEHYVGRRHLQARELFEKTRAAGAILSAQQAAMLGMSLYHLGMYSEAINELASVAGKLRGELRTTAEYHLASSYILNEEPKLALDVLRDATRNGSGPYKFPSEILLAQAYYQAEDELNNELISEAKARIISTAAEESVGNELADSTVVPSLIYSVAYAAISASSITDALDYLECAASVAPPGLLPMILMTRYSLLEDSEARKQLAITAARTIIENQLHPVSDRSALAAYSDRVFIGVLIALEANGEMQLVRELIEFSVNNEKSHSTPLVYVAEVMSMYPTHNVLTWDIIHSILNSVDFEKADVSEKVPGLRALAIHTRGDSKVNVVEEYALAAASLPDYMFSEPDVAQIVTTSQSLYTGNELDRALRLIRLPQGRMSADVDALWRMMVVYHRMIIQNGLSKFEDAKASAKEVLDLQPTVAGESPKEIGDFLNMVVGQASKVLDFRASSKPDIYRRIGRNQKIVVKDNNEQTERTVKFKLVESDLRSGKVRLIRVLPIN